MVMTDPIADLLTRIRNANQMKYTEVSMPASNEKKAILAVMKEQGFIRDFEFVSDDKQGILNVTLKYTESKERVIKGLKRISKPGLRVYVKSNEIPKVFNGLGIAIISTSKGIITGKEAERLNLGGEVLAYIW